MGVTIHYSGQLADPRQLERLEDLVIDLVLELGGSVEVWRSGSEEHSPRVVRGLIVNLEPGQESLSLLFSPEGWLIPFFDIEEIERGSSGAESWCFVKTQFGTPVGHAAVVELLSILRDRFIPTLEVRDETGYWEHRDPWQMVQAFGRPAMIMDAFASALEDTTLSSEALEDPEIVVTRIERIAGVVHRQLEQQALPRADNEKESADFANRWPEIEAHWHEIVRQNDARTRRQLRDVEESLLSGADPDQALEEACAAEFTSEPPSTGDAVFVAGSDDANVEGFAEGEDGPLAHAPQERDPLLERATGLYVSLMRVVRSDPSPQVGELLRHAGELCGGLAQALPLPPPYEFDPDERGLTVTQLKRALRGAAFLRGALNNLAYASQEAGNDYNVLREEVEAVQGEIVDCLRIARPAPQE